MGDTNVLVIGGGGREHAITWALQKSPRLGALYVAPGNAGTAEIAQNVNLDTVAETLQFAADKNIHLVVIGPEAPLVAGWADELRAGGVAVFGPSQAAAQLEASKAFSKAFMREHNIPTADSRTFNDYDAALAYAESVDHAVVVKADGLAAGKGVIVCDDVASARAALKTIMHDAAFGAAGDTVIIEERLIGREVSILAFCDGHNVALMPAMRDHKRIFDGDQGLNTGGMGAFGPVADVSADDLAYFRDAIIKPAVAGMAARGTPYVGVLYAGLMLTQQSVRTLEFNCRFGDPETQAILPLLDSDLLTIMLDCAAGSLNPADVRWKSGFCATVVAASGGYPGDYQTGIPINGLDAVSDSVVFHAGVRRLEPGGHVTAGGRVLAVSAVGDTLDSALATAYADIARIDFDGMHYRRDIGRTEG
ncbi:MAG: phosphoribosylamine--glycine ligase [Anaerolineaceae bacterium]|nr:MAG: phosphoribosylamine--glycine ligase [Anaerolineaceae bacterium]